MSAAGWEQRLAVAVEARRQHRALHVEAHERRTVGQRLADTIAVRMGSWPFLIGQSVLLMAWIAANLTEWLTHAWDPYPFILLNLCLSFQAAYAAPIIMMSQNRAAAKDRAQADLDLETDLKAELLIEEIHAALCQEPDAWAGLVVATARQTVLLEQLVGRT